MKKILLLATGIMILSFARAQSPQSPCSADATYRQFDFWIGEWEAYNTNGKKAGDSRIERALDSCVIVENWSSAQSNYSGKSYNTFNSVTKKWQQYWVDNKGGVTEYFDGHYDDGKMILQTINQKQPDGSYKIQKMTFYNLDPKKMRQHGESSTDGGITWKTDFDLEYRRK